MSVEDYLRRGYKRGMVLRVHMHNFLTYDDAEVCILSTLLADCQRLTLLAHISLKSSYNILILRYRYFLALVLTSFLVQMVQASQP